MSAVSTLRGDNQGETRLILIVALYDADADDPREQANHRVRAVRRSRGEPRKRSCSMARICARTSCCRSGKRWSSAWVLSGSGVPSAVRMFSSLSAAWRSLSRKLPTPKRARIALMRLMSRVCSSTRIPRSRFGRRAFSS